MGKRGPQPTRHLTAVRDGNPAHRPIKAQPKLPPARPPEPTWVELFPTSRVADLLVGLKGADRARAKTAVARRNGESLRARRVAREAWRRWCRVLFAQGLLAEVDAEQLQDAAVVWAELDRAVRDVARRGSWVEGERGAVKNPSVTAQAQYRIAFKAYSAALGLAPTYRIGLIGTWDPPEGAGSGEDDDPFD